MKSILNVMAYLKRAKICGFDVQVWRECTPVYCDADYAKKEMDR